MRKILKSLTWPLNARAALVKEEPDVQGLSTGWSNNTVVCDPQVACEKMWIEILGK